MNKQVLLSTQVRIRKPCRGCDSSGTVYDPRCELCYRQLSENQVADLGLDSRYLPCDHHVKHLSEERACRACDGSGQVAKWIRLVELAALLKRAAKIELCQNCKRTAVPDGNPLCPACRALEDEALSQRQAEIYEGAF